MFLKPVSLKRGLRTVNRNQPGAAGLTFSFLPSFKMWEIVAPIMLVKNNNSLGLAESERFFWFCVCVCVCVFPAFVGKVNFMAKVELKCQPEEVRGIGGGY